jgi:hypothetical protein
MSFAPPQIIPPPIPPELPQPQGGFWEFVRDVAALPGRFFGWLGSKITSLSFAAYIAWFVFFVLLIIVAVFWFVLRHDGDVPWQQTLTVERIVVGGLVLLIPFVTYKAVLNWTETVTSEFPDIQDAWNRGLSALRDHSLDLNAHPLFLIIGSVDLRQERSLMAASNLKFVVGAVPPGPAPLHFYASPDAIYLILSDASYLSALLRLVGHQPLQTRSGQSGTGSRQSSAIDQFSSRTLDVSTFMEQQESGAAAPQESSAMDQFSKQTLDVSTFFAQRERAEELRQQPLSDIADQSTLKPGSLIYGSDERDVRLSAQEAIDQTSRIRYVAQLIRAARYPLCPINGVMVLIPFNVLSVSDDAVREVQRAIKFDLASLQETLTLKAPTVAMFTGLEQEDGFRELVRRVGPAGASRQRFGQGMDVRCRATAEELDALAAHACGAFEDWVYTLFREDGALTRPGNTLLHSLLCTVRSRLKNPIAELLSNGFGNSTGNAEAETSFVGCYFAATGDSDDQRAFVRGVFDKLTDSQEDLEWTSHALQTSRSSSSWLYAGIASCVVFAVCLVLMIAKGSG